MNKPILLPQLSATRARTGMNRVGDLIALLIKQYEMQDQLRTKRQNETARRSSVRARTRSLHPAAPASLPTTTESQADALTAQFSNARTSQGKTKPVQATFAWFDSACPEPATV